MWRIYIYVLSDEFLSRFGTKETNLSWPADVAKIHRLVMCILS